jgi:predicted nucleic acid-binding protein
MKTLVDTSAWIQFFSNGGSKTVSELLSEDRALIHSKILGELACGNFSGRDRYLKDLKMLPRAMELSDAECMQFIEDEKLYGKGLSFIDIHLLASSRLTGCLLFTHDKALKRYSS